MARESEFARDYRAKCAAMFPGKEELCAAEVGRFAGCDYRTAKKRYPFEGRKHISVVKLCNAMGS